MSQPRQNVCWECDHMRSVVHDGEGWRHINPVGQLGSRCEAGVYLVQAVLTGAHTLGKLAPPPPVTPAESPAEAAVRPQERPEGSEATHTAERTVTDPTEQTAERGLGDWLIEELHLTIRQWRPLALLAETDPDLAAVFDVPLSRLREDLAIAARARACEQRSWSDWHIEARENHNPITLSAGWNALLAYLLEQENAGICWAQDATHEPEGEQP